MKFFDDVFNVIELLSIDVISRKVFIEFFLINLIFESVLRLLESENIVYDLFF